MTGKHHDAAEAATQMRIANEIMDRDREVLRALAEHEGVVERAELEAAREKLVGQRPAENS